MSNSNLKLETKEKKWIKYFIFSFAMFLAFFIVQTGQIAKAETTSPSATFELFESNHSGDGNSKDAVKVCKTGGTGCNPTISEDVYGSGWYVQTRGKGKSGSDVFDTVSLKLVVTNFVGNINGVTVFESKFSSSAGANASYDAYVKKDTTWTNVTGAGLEVGFVETTAPGADGLDAENGKLKANGGVVGGTTYNYYSIMNIVQDGSTITINYVYTIRSNDYGQKEIVFALYNTLPYNWSTGEWLPGITAETFRVQFVASKPASEFNIHWMSDNSVKNTGGETVGTVDLYNNTIVIGANTYTIEDTAVKLGTDKVGTIDGSSLKISGTDYTIDFSAGGDDGKNRTNNILITYVNGEKQTGTKNMYFVLPRQMAYYHNVATTTTGSGADEVINPSSIPDNTIYAINSFANDGSEDGWLVKYYYYDFNWKASADNIEMDPTKTYNLYLVIDAKGSYAFYIKDVFGNTISSEDSGSDKVEVEDVSNTNIIIDYTNAQDLTLLTASAQYSDNTLGWKSDWVFEFDTSEKINFAKMQPDITTIEVHTFHRIVINNGVHVGEDADEKIEGIAKQPLEHVDSDEAAENSEPNVFTSGNVKIWRVKTISGDAGAEDNVSCGTGAANNESICYSDLSYDTSSATYGASKNKITFKITNNGRYRIKITDNYSNTTNSLTGASKNPAVEVSIIDKTDPIITSGLTGANNTSADITGGAKAYSAANSISTYDYVHGGGKVSTSVPGTETQVKADDDYYKTNVSTTYASIYYEPGGDKVFDYKDALEIAKIKVVDDVWYYDGSVFNKDYSGYEVYMNAHDSDDANHGKYIDPSADYKSDRNTTATKTENASNENMHEFIINKNITSFTGGLVRQVGYTAYVNDNEYTKIAGNSSYATPFVNDKTQPTFLGYLKIVFVEKISNNEVCELKITSDESDSNSDNETCMKYINKMIDDVENFDMVFSTVDYKGNASNEFTVSVSIIDNTNAGIINRSTTNPLKYTNTSTVCRLEMGNNIQSKANLLECYGLTDTSGSVTYNFKDNNVHAYYHDGTNKVNKWDSDTTDTNYTYAYSFDGYQYYGRSNEGVELTATSDEHYYNKIKLYVYEGEWKEINTTDVMLKKSGDHMIRVEIRDHWKNFDSASNHNLLTFYVNYYVNPRTLLIEPLAMEKMYGENDPVLEYCVYVNSYNSTFDLEAAFFDVEFINTYFTKIYCTKDVFAELASASRYKVSSTGTKSYTAEVDGEDVSISYEYNIYAPDPAGAYLKVNNTYVQITSEATYYGGYKQSDTGNYLKHDGAYYPIKSGYSYKDANCKYAYTGATGEELYLNISTDCVKVQNTNRRDFVYRKATGVSGIEYDGKQYLKYNSSNTNDSSTDALPNINESLVNENEYQGQLTRVESSCYNSFETDGVYGDYVTSCLTADTIATRNDNVGQYNIALGTLSIKIGEDDVDYNSDYVIKINTNYWAATTNFGTAQAGRTANKSDLFDDGKLTDDTIFAESNVKFTVRQAVLTITTNGSSKKYGEQDPYSNVWNDEKTQINAVSTGYLGGYSVHGWRNGDSADKFGNATINTNTADGKYIILGTLRREVGEEVGIYTICNLASNPKTVDGTTCLRDHDSPGYYDSANIYYFNGYDGYKDDGTSDTITHSLHIRTNADIYGNATGRTLNTGTRNYAISFVNIEKMVINPIDLIVQPGINQGKEYAAKAYHDPLWQLVIYGETDISDGYTETVANDPNENDDSFNGYTTDVVTNSNAKNRNLGVGPYYCLNNTDTGCTSINPSTASFETEVYFARRKYSPDSTYTYTQSVTFTNADRYTKSSDIYYKSTTGNYIYKFGQYYDVSSVVNNTDTEFSTNLTVTGELVNETYSLFGTGFALKREAGGTVGWYTYNTVKNFEGSVYTIKPVTQRIDDQCVITDTSVTINANSADKVKCRNYNVVYTNLAPNLDESKYKTVYTASPTQVYEPNGTNACTDGEIYSKACDAADSKQILFEIFKREIVVEFIDDNYTFIYGNRYDYYDGGVATSTTYGYNDNTDGIFYINNSTSEGDIFLCYSDLGDYLVDCTNDADYGLTSGDTWSGIGLRFYLHSEVSAYDGGYYITGSSKAVPAGTYYVYAEIGATDNYGTDSNVLNNYKFTYIGGTLTIKPKTTSVELSGYTMEYGESKYNSYGTGSNYSEYTIYSGCDVLDSYYTEATAAVKATLISITGCSEANVAGNTYGFTIEGLDDKDTIVTNFKGRPARETRRNNNVGVFDDVGYYKIGVGTIANIQDTSVDFKKCTTNIKADGTVDTTCVFVGSDAASDINAMNYDISYSIANNEGSYLFITPAKLDIDVEPNQTKMYGCAYYQFITDGSSYYKGYTYASGYVDTNCKQGTNPEIDMAYKYNVTGDKDVKSASNATTTYYVTTAANGDRETNIPAAAKDKIVLTDTRLYRVTKEADNVYAYGDIRAINQKAIYQGQSVGVYTITLGNLTVADNVNTAMCDDYNNPVLEGGSKCRNYNINYYGNSTTTDISAHKYTETTEVDVSKLAKYVLNYEVDNTDGEYIFVNGKFVRIADLPTNAGKVLVNSYINKNTKASADPNSNYVLTRYKKYTQYIEDASCTLTTAGCYVYVDLDGSGTGDPAGYYLISSSAISSRRYATYGDSDSQATDGAYIKINDNYIRLDTFKMFKASGANADGYIADKDGEYVLINNKYVQLDSLQTYSYVSASDTYCEFGTTGCTATDGAEGNYVLIYEYRELNATNFTRYTLSATSANMYKQDQSAATSENVYVFIDGSYVPYKSLNIVSGKITVNMARLIDGDDADTDLDEARGSVTTDTDFTITARVVYVHPEYNVKPYQDEDPLEYITCAEIKQAYNLDDDFTGRTSYCGGTKTQVDLGVAMYYAVQNSLAKSPWTAWTDSDVATVTGEGASQTIAHTYALYNDIQYDVLTGKLDRYTRTANGYTTDIAGKYTYDFKNVTNVGTINGANYMIVHVTKEEMKDTYIDISGTKTALNTLVYNYVGDSDDTDDCKLGDPYCAYINFGTTASPDYKLTKVKDNQFVYGGSSISLIQKYAKVDASSYNEMDYWYLGFYKNDETEGRENELAKWWSNRSPFSGPYDTFKNSNDSNNKIEDNDFSEKQEVYFEIIRRTIYLYVVDTEKTYGEADNYNDILVAICSNDDGYILDGNGVRCANTESSLSYGLGASDLGKFTETKTIGADTYRYMKQNQIKNKGQEGEYIFQGATDKEDSFGIYFRRDNNENVGVYTITACAMQSDIIDCTRINEEEVEHTSMDYLGDNYKIIEVPGVFAIKPRVININPHSSQGFEYGNYSENGTMPNITFSESSVLGTYDSTNGKVIINGVTYTITGTNIMKRSLDVGDIDTTNNRIVLNGVAYTISGTDILSVGGLVFGNKAYLDNGAVKVDSGVYLYNGTTNVASITITNNSNVLVNEFTISTNTYYIDGLDVINKTTKTKAGYITVATTGGNLKTLTVGGTTYDLVQKAKCLINVSGLHTVCINDAQNESLKVNVDDLFIEDAGKDISINEKYAVYGANYTTNALSTEIRRGTIGSETKQKVIESDKYYYNYNVYADDYSNPANVYDRTETSSRSALNLKCGTTENLRYSRDVCEYSITIGDLAISSTVKNATATYFYVHLADSRKYNRTGSEGSYVYTPQTQADPGEFVRYGDKYIEIGATKYRMATKDDYDKNNDANATNNVTIIDGRYVEDNTDGTYIRVANSTTNTNYNIVGFDATKKFVVTPATLEVTPESMQYKIYGDKDPEIKFTVETTFTVANTHYLKYSNSNIVRLCNVCDGTDDYDFDTELYASKGATTTSTSGTYVLLVKGWKVTLNTYAYSETSGAEKLDYGKNFTSSKHNADDQELGQETTGLVHYDRFTTYNTQTGENNDIETSRILLGNLYVTDHDQEVGVKVILSGLKIGRNNLNAGTNYTLKYEDDGSTSYRFTIIPRPINVEIQNVTKTYGQATDKNSCDSYVGEGNCVVGEGILTAEDNNSLLANNFNVIDKSVGAQTITITGVGNLSVTYGDEKDMPTQVSATGSVYSGYAISTGGKYYTEDEGAGNKNTTLNIEVTRENYNIARGTDACLISGETYCEDVGEYFLAFKVTTAGKTIESAITNAYYKSYWGYNPNYYVIVYNKFEASGWATGEYSNAITAKTDVYYAAEGKLVGTEYVGQYSTSTVIDEDDLTYGNTYTANSVPGPTATLKIRKRNIQIVVETIEEYEYTAKTDGKGDYIKVGSSYYLITKTNRYKKLATNSYVQVKLNEAQAIGQYVCTYVASDANVDSNCHAITADNTFTRKAKTVGEKYNIEENIDVPGMPAISNRGDDNSGEHHTTYEYITWYEQPRQVRTSDALYGNVAYCTTTLTLPESGIDGIRSYTTQNCSGGLLKYFANSSGTYDPNDGDDTMFFDTGKEGYYIITRDEDELYIKNTGISDSSYEDNNYTTEFINGVLQIDPDETAPVINVGTEFITKEANKGNMSLSAVGDELSFLETNTLRTNNCTTSREDNVVEIECDGIVFTYEDSAHQTATPTISLDDIYVLLDWFDISSYDAGIMRAGVAQNRRYDPRWYITIQSDFDQRKVGDYTVFVYAQDLAGNISLATTTTLRIVDTTAPTVGTLNLYDTKVKCKTNTDCNIESNWVVDAGGTNQFVYLPIHTITGDKLTAFQADPNYDSNKYAISSTGVYSLNNTFGTYYKIKDGTTAAAVRHTGWTNSNLGIWMTITGGDDNSLTYLDTSKYAKRYKLTGDNFSENNVDGDNLLLGNLIHIDGITKYRIVTLDSNNDEGSGTKKVYIPDREGTIIKYKGYYYDLKDGKYYDKDAQEVATAPSHPYNVKLYSHSSGAYTKQTTAWDSTNEILYDNYYLLDGEMYLIPSGTNDTYSRHEVTVGMDTTIEYRHSSSGTYVNIAQWDSYYTRDGGYSWIKYDRDAVEGSLALGQDGQRLIMIKAIDNGYSYAAVDTTIKFVEASYSSKVDDGHGNVTVKWNDVSHENGYKVSISTNPDVGDITIATNTVTISGVIYKISGTKILEVGNDQEVGTYDAANNKIEIGAATYTIDGTNVIDDDGIVVRSRPADGKYQVYNGTKTMHYNISEWEDYNANGNRDMKFAYLDTIMPIVEIAYNGALTVYEYDCGDDLTRCTTNHNEEFGTARDGYVYPLDQLVKYEKEGTNAYTPLGYNSDYNVNGNYVLVYGEYIEITAARRYAKDNTNTNACVGKTGADCMYTPSDSGNYIYIRSLETIASGTIDETITDAIGNRLTSTVNDSTANKLKIYNANSKEADEADKVYVITMPTTSKTDLDTHIQANTWYIASGLGMGTTVFDGIDNTDKQIGSGTKTSGDAFTAGVDDKFVTIFIYADVRNGGTITGHDYLSGLGNYKFKVTKSTSYQVEMCYSDSDAFHESEWCASPTSKGTFANMQAAINSVLAVYSNAGDGTNKFKFNKNDITFTVDYRVMDLAGNISMYVRKGMLFDTFVTNIAAAGAAVASLSNRVEVEVTQNGDVMQLLSDFAIVSSNGKAFNTDERIVQTTYYNGIVVSENQKYDLTTLSNIDTTKPGEYKVVYTVQRKDGTEYINGNSVELVVTIKPNLATVNYNNFDYLMISVIVVSMFALATIAYISLRKRENN